jgi:hypothetical protein
MSSTYFKLSLWKEASENSPSRWCYIFDLWPQKGFPPSLSSNSPLLAARDEFEFACIQLNRRVSGADVIPCPARAGLQGKFITR